MKVMLSLSGGLDSAVLLSDLLHQGHEVVPVSFVYGSKHNAYENAAAKALVKYHRLPNHRTIDLSSVLGDLNSDLLKSGGELPEGHYEAETMRRTVVPGRNLLFASVLASLAESEGCQEIQLGVHAGDHFIYPDCRPEFIYSLALSIFHSTDGKVKVRAPFLYLLKSGVVHIGILHGTPFRLTRTCYKDQIIACGRCGSCQERLAAFRQEGKPDPLDYETRDPLPKES
jgi:7-cyano-7-deazaguanine synthase